MRRFRATWLRKQRAPGRPASSSGWGHAKGTMTDAYSKLERDLDFRREVAEEDGTSV